MRKLRGQFSVKRLPFRYLKLADDMSDAEASGTGALRLGSTPWLKPVAEFFLSLGKILGKTFTGVGEWLWQF